MKRLSCTLILLSVLIILAACTVPTTTPVALVASPQPSFTPPPPTTTSAPTDTPASTSTPTPQPSNTPTIKPTATSTVTPTATVTKIAVTLTLRPTKTATATKAAAAVVNAPAPVPVSAAIPAGASLSQAVELVIKGGHIIQGEINNAMAGRRGDCNLAIPQYDLITSAPAYDVGAQSAETQAAYDLYQHGIERVKATAPKIRRVCQGGGNIGNLDLFDAAKGISDALAFFGRARDLLPAAAPLPTVVAKPTATPVISSMALSDLLVKTRDQVRLVTGLLDGAQTNLDAGFCQQFVPLYNSIITPVTLNEAGHPAAWAEQYSAYKIIISFFQNKLYRVREACEAGSGKIGPAEFRELRQAAEAANNALARAYDQLNNKNLLGQ